MQRTGLIGNLARIASGSGTFLILLLLMLVFSVLTLKTQSSTGADAGRASARRAFNSLSTSATAVIIATASPEDREFAAGAEAEMKKLGLTLAGMVNGGPPDARRLLDQLAAEDRFPSVLIASGSSSRWTVFDRYEEFRSEMLIVPREELWPDFLKLSNLLGVASQTAIYAIIAVGMTMVIISREIDLSVGSVLALASVTTTVCLRDHCDGMNADILNTLFAIGLGLALATVAGAVNGLMLTVFRLPSFIVTLGMMLMARGAAQLISRQQSIGSSAIPPLFRAAGGIGFLGIPNPVWLMVGLYAAAHFLMSRTLFGRMLYAIGGNPEAAELCGIRIARIRLLVFSISGFLAGLGGLLLSARLNAGDPKYGEMYELEVIAAVVVGGTSLLGGEGRMLGTLAGAFIIAIIRNGMNLLGVDSASQSIVLGSVLLTAVLIDQAKRRWQQQ